MPCVCETEETLLPDIHTQELLDLGKAPCVSLIKVVYLAFYRLSVYNAYRWSNFFLELLLKAETTVVWTQVSVQ